MVISTGLIQNLRADEGMWLPILLSQGTEAEMKRLGMKITAEDIFSLNKPSIKDAICLFGGGCTSEIISSQGLLLTNYHCGYSAIQAHSSVELDYLTDGFWAKSNNEELPNPNLKVSVLVNMEDVTNNILQGINDDFPLDKRQALIETRITALQQEKAKGTKNIVKIEPFYSGNQYIMVVYQVYYDIRLVGAPPSRIGKFGGDTDNWMWPRQTGDFSLFRIYVDKNNNPAEYSKDNVPYNPPYHLTISLKGIQSDDFTFVYGYPGSTQEYLPSYAVERLTNFENPAAIKLREKKLEIYNQYMVQSKLTRIQYSAKYAGVENYYKKMIGENKGVIQTDIITRKKLLEKQFDNWAQMDEKRKLIYGHLVSDFKNLYDDNAANNLAVKYLIESGLGIEIVRFARSFEKLVMLSKDKNEGEIAKYAESLKKNAIAFFKNYDSRIDKEVMTSLLGIYYNNLDHNFVPEEIVANGEKYKGDFSEYSEFLFRKSILVDKLKLNNFLSAYKYTKSGILEKDPAYKLGINIYDFYKRVLSKKYEEFQNQFDELYRIYIKGLIEMNPEKKFYPDANLTLRVAYGTVKGFIPRDGIEYKYFTTLKGVIEKEDSTIYDYVVDERLKDLYYKKDYGKYADKDGSMHVAFIASNHTTGGNSGSPVMNAEGHLIGINFDRVWEGTMSDIVYDEARCRNISMDIRYCMFIIDKYAGASHLLNEMTFSN